MARKKPDVDWLVLGPEPYLAHCTRCGVTIAKPPLPCDLGDFVRYLHGAAEMHALCREAQS